MIKIYDSMSAFRIRLETGERQLLRGILNEVTPTTFFVWDAKGGNDARRAIFPGYKNRPPAPQKMYQALQMIRELLSYTPAYQAWHDGFEGDDVIAALVEEFRGIDEIQIHTGDGDLAALGVSIIGRQPKIPTELVRLYKVTVGDQSDTIPGIKGFGKGAWEAADKNLLADFVDNLLSGGTWTDQSAEAIGFSKSSINWLRQNEDQVRAMWTVINPLPMTKEQLTNAIRQGTDNPAERQRIMENFLL